MTPNAWPHQVEIKLDKQSAGERLRRIQAWCTDWLIGFRVHGIASTGTVRAAFEDVRFARAFHSHFGGVIVPSDATAVVETADAHTVDLFDRLAGDYAD